MTTTAQPPAPTPPQEDLPAKGYGSWVPHDLPYNGDFEDSLIDIILNPSDVTTTENAIRVIPEDSDETPVDGKSVRFQDVDLTNLPTLTEHDLPIPLTDARRIYASPIAGIKITHPDGWIEGGPALDPNMDTFADDFLSQHSDITNLEQLQRAVKKEVDANMEVLKGRLRARQQAKQQNERIAKEIRTLMDQHDLELRIQQKSQEDQRRKKEAKKRKLEKEGGG